jgi:hypothetical protein
MPLGLCAGSYVSLGGQNVCLTRGLSSNNDSVSFPDRLTAQSRLLRVRSGHAEVEI